MNTDKSNLQGLDHRKRRKVQRVDEYMNTKMALFPCACHASASSALNTTCPTAAPGDAGKPVATTLSL